MAVYVHRSAVVEAMQFDGKNHIELAKFCGITGFVFHQSFQDNYGNWVVLEKPTIGYGNDIVHVGDWAVKESGTFWFCDKYTFEKIFMTVGEVKL